MPALIRDRFVIFPRLLVNDDEVSLLVATMVRDQLHRRLAHEHGAVKATAPGQGRNVPVLVKRIRAVARVELLSERGADVGVGSVANVPSTRSFSDF